MTLTVYFEGIIKKQKEIGYAFPDTLCPPASESEIEGIETSIGFRLNDELRELFRLANGSQYSNLLLGLIPIHRLLNLQEAKGSFDNYIKNENLFNEAFENWETGEKPGCKLFPFLADYSLHTYWVDLNVGSKNYGKIYDALMSGESPFYAFDSLTTMFKVTYECYKDNIFYLDENGWLESDSKRFAEVCKRNNPDILYWQTLLRNLNSSNSDQ